MREEPGSGRVRRAVEEALGALLARMRARDVDGALALFHADAVVFGSERDECAVGSVELRALLLRLFARPAHLPLVRLGDAALRRRRSQRFLR